MKDNNYVSMQISKRAIDMSVACYENLQKKDLKNPETMFFLVALIAGIARANDEDIILDDSFIANIREELNKWEKGK